MILITITAEDTDSGRANVLSQFVVQHGYNKNSGTLPTPMIAKDGLIFYKFDFISWAYNEEEMTSSIFSEEKLIAGPDDPYVDRSDEK